MDLAYIAHLLNGLLMAAMPIMLAVYLTRAWKLSWRFWLVGAAVFILSQVGHIPFNAVVSGLLNQTGMVNWPAGAREVFNAAFLGLSAGLFEELARYAMYRWWLKDARSWRRGVLVGAGHGGAEAIILGVITVVAFFQLSVYRNMDLSTVVPAAQLEAARAQVTAYWSMPWYEALLGALERFFTIPIQIALSVIVLQTFTRGQGFWLWLAVLLHALVDATAVYLLPYLGVTGIESLVAVYALAAIGIIFALRQAEPVEAAETPPEPTGQAAGELLGAVEETPENLDASIRQ